MFVNNSRRALAILVSLMLALVAPVSIATATAGEETPPETTHSFDPTDPSAEEGTCEANPKLILPKQDPPRDYDYKYMVKVDGETNWDKKGHGTYSSDLYFGNEVHVETFWWKNRIGIPLTKFHGNPRVGMEHWKHTYEEAPAPWECNSPEEPEVVQQPKCEDKQVVSGVINIPENDIYYYTLNGDKVDPGNHEVPTGEHTVKAYVIDDNGPNGPQGTWTLTIDETPEIWDCNPPSEPSHAQPVCLDGAVVSGIITIPESDVYYYTIDGEPVDPGEHEVEAGDHTVEVFVKDEDSSDDESIDSKTININENPDVNCLEPVVELTATPTCYPEPQTVEVTNPEGNFYPVSLDFDDHDNPRDLPVGETASYSSDADIVVWIDGNKAAEYPYPAVPGCPGEPGPPGEPGDGKDGEDGNDGKDGEDGKDATPTPTPKDTTTPVNGQLPDTGADSSTTAGAAIVGVAILAFGTAMTVLAHRRRQLN